MEEGNFHLLLPYYSAEVKGNFLSVERSARDIGKVMAELMLISQYNIEDLLNMDLKKFVRAHESIARDLHFSPLVSLTDGNGILDARHILSPISKIERRLRKEIRR